MVSGVYRVSPSNGVLSRARIVYYATLKQSGSNGIDRVGETVNALQRCWSPPIRANRNIVQVSVNKRNGFGGTSEGIMWWYSPKKGNVATIIVMKSGLDQQVVPTIFAEGVSARICQSRYHTGLEWSESKWK